MLEHKVAQNFSIAFEMLSLVFTQKVKFFKAAQKVTSYFGYICDKFVSKNFQN